jgi:hypothetical protein
MYQLQFTKMELLYLTQFGIEYRKVTQVQRFKSHFLFGTIQEKEKTAVFKFFLKPGRFFKKANESQDLI